MLKAQNRVFRIEKHVHNYPHCWRTDKPVLYYPLDSWFIRTTACRERMIELNNTINWKPQSTGTGRFGKWLENLQDWNLSRSRYWGTPLPIWRTEDGAEEICIGSVEELYNEIEKSVKAGLMESNPYKELKFQPGEYTKENYEKIDLHRPYVDDVILVSDTSMIGRDIPSITTGLRGLAYWQVEVTGPNADLHSGIFGGAVANPINVLCKMIADMQDEKGHITIPGFYDDVLEVSAEERAKMAKAPFDLENYKKSLDIKEVKGEEGFTTNERTGIRPTFDVCGIWGGYTGEGAKTVLPSKAYAKISCRLVPNQKHEKIAKLFKEYFESIAPDYVKVKVDYLHGGPSYVCPIDLPAYKAAEKAYEEVYGKQPVPVRSGGSIPIIATFEEVLGIKSVLMGFGLGSDAIHSPNENYPLEQFFNGITTIPLFYKYFGEIMKK